MQCESILTVLLIIINDDDDDDDLCASINAIARSAPTAPLVASMHR